MKRFEIFRPGKHTAGSGVTLTFSEADMQRCAAVYDPAVHEAPIVVGHPKDNGPAYGWVGSLAYQDAALSADPIQLEETFSEMVVAGRFKHRSAAFYTPNSSNHPLAGKDGHDAYYLRHVGFLGAAAPAVKGLKPVEFAADDTGVVEFSDSVDGTVAALFRRMREFFISKYSLEDADKVIPDYSVSTLEADANRQPDPSAPWPAYTEESTMTQTEIDALKVKADRADLAEAALAAANLKAATDAATAGTTFAEREKTLNEREAALARSEVAVKLEALVKSGRVLPAAKAAALEFAMSLGAGSDVLLTFKEADKELKLSQRDFYLKQLESGPQLVTFKEVSGDPEGRSESGLTAAQIQEKALALQASKKAVGVELSYREACGIVNAEQTIA